MIRAKRCATVKAHITPEMRAELERLVAEAGHFMTLSDYLYRLLDDHISERRTARSVSVALQHIGELRNVNS